ncbi:MAG: CehA/McbA family metallohydrolase [Planctomycetaceae bacterium]
MFLFAVPAFAANGSLRVEIADEKGKPVPCQVYLHDAAGKSIRAPGLPFWHDHFVCDGAFELSLPPGSYEYEIERGPEYRPLGGSVTIEDSRRTTENLHLARIADLASDGWYSGELHVHRPVEQIPLLMQAADLHVAPVITWWNATNLWANRELPAPTLNRFDGNRFYDVMAGEDEREGGALLFLGLKKPLAITAATREHPSPMKFASEARAGGAWIDIEKPFWWDVPVWLATGVADSIGIANNHMCRSTMYENEAWGKPRDSKRLPSPLGNGYWSQEIYYHALNCGLRLPPSAGSASGVLPNPVGYNRVYVHTGDKFDDTSWWDGLKAGRSFVTNGPLLVTRAAGHLPGHVFSVDAGRTLEIPLDVSLISNDNVPVIEVIKDGQVARTVPVDGGTSFKGSIGSITFDKSGWFLIRAVTDNRRTFRFASTAPYYVEIGPDKRRVSRASAQFFLDWAIERASRVPNKLDDPAQLREVLEHHTRAREFWEKKVSEANDD